MTAARADEHFVAGGLDPQLHRPDTGAEKPLQRLPGVPPVMAAAPDRETPALLPQIGAHGKADQMIQVIMREQHRKRWLLHDLLRQTQDARARVQQDVLSVQTHQYAGGSAAIFRAAGIRYAHRASDAQQPYFIHSFRPFRFFQYIYIIYCSIICLKFQCLRSNNSEK